MTCASDSQFNKVYLALTYLHDEWCKLIRTKETIIQTEETIKDVPEDVLKKIFNLTKYDIPYCAYSVFNKVSKELQRRKDCELRKIDEGIDEKV